MKKQTGLLVIGIGIASVLTRIYSAIHSGELIDSLSGILIGAALIGTVLFEWSKQGKSK